MSADPEGIAWYERKHLKTDLYDPEDAKQFYTTALIEVPYNDAPTDLWDGGHRKNPRLERQFESWTRWKYLDVMYGASETNITRRYRVEAKDNWWDLNRDKLQVCKVPVPMPTEEEVNMWIDLSWPIRAVQFPLCQKAREHYQHMATFRQLDFKRREIWMKGYGGRENPTGITHYARDIHRGLRYFPMLTLKLDVLNIQRLAMLSPSSTETDLYMEAAQTFRAPDVNHEDAKLTTISKGMENNNMIDIVKLWSAEQGIKISYDKVQQDPHFLVGAVVNLVQVGAGCVPYIGPLLVIAVEFGYQAILNPDQFRRSVYGEALAARGPEYIDAVLKSAFAVESKMKVKIK